MKSKGRKNGINPVCSPLQNVYFILFVLFITLSYAYRLIAIQAQFESQSSYFSGLIKFGKHQNTF